jgi:hypothetical protein
MIIKAADMINKLMVVNGRTFISDKTYTALNGKMIRYLLLCCLVSFDREN